MKQTTVQEFNSIRFGSGKFEVDDGSGFVNLGAMRSIVFEEEWEKARVMSHNAGMITARIHSHRAALAGDLMEINLENLSKVRGGLDTYTVEDGTLVTGHEQVVAAGAWELDRFIMFDQQSYAAGEKVAPDSLTLTGNGTSYVEDTDFYVAQDSVGNFGIVVLDTTDSDITHTLTLNYDYTPAAKKIFESGGKRTINPVAVRVTNYNEDEAMFRITVYKAEVEEGITIELQGDEEEDPAVTPVRLVGDVDETKDVGKQLFKIEDYQNV